MADTPAAPPSAAADPNSAHRGPAGDAVTEEAAGVAEGEEPTSPSERAQDDVTVEEIGGPSGPDPTRFGDWERKGRCIDF